MLYFQRVLGDQLKAVTHVDGSARAQTVSAADNPRMHALLSAFRDRTGYGVLCNTSLNFNGKGFINRLSDLARYARDAGLDGFVVGETFYRKN
jgi:hydroxymethyl cephem carbamoyltransferase